jgi:adenine-specific DNA-methyltransferase
VPKKGQLSGNPLGKNPGDVWYISSVNGCHVEKTAHPCQFPVAIPDLLIRSLTREGDWVLDPFMGAGTTLVAALMNGRRGAGADLKPEYVAAARDRIASGMAGELRVRATGIGTLEPAPSNGPIRVALRPPSASNHPGPDQP